MRLAFVAKAYRVIGDALVPDDEAEDCEGFQGCRLVAGVDGEVEVAMGPALATGERVDAPAATDPGSTAGGLEGVEDGEDVGGAHPPPFKRTSGS